MLTLPEVEPLLRWAGPIETAGRCPVYVDFDDSILDRDVLLASCGASGIPRSASRLRRALRRLSAPDGVTRRNTGRMLALLREDVEQPTVLVVGGGAVGLGVEALYSDAHVRVVAFDIYASPHVQFIADAHRIPLDDGTVDAVVVQAVLEHVLDPARVVAEVERVVRPGGLVYAETPFLQQVHEGPYDFTRFTESGHRWLFRGFERVDSGVVSGPGMQLVWSLSNLIGGILRSRRAVRVARVGLFWLRFLDLLIPEDHQVDGACGVHFLGRRSAVAIEPAAMVGHYRGAQQ